MDLNRFTKRYSLTRSLQFSLKPVEQTARFQEENRDFEFDEEVIKNVYALTPTIDKAVIDIMSKGLAGIDYDFASFDPDCSKKELEGVYAKLAEPAKKVFSDMMVEAKKDDKKQKESYAIKVMRSADFVQKVLPNYTDDIELISSFVGCNDRLVPILISREVALTDSMPKRILENLDRYKSNIKALDKILASEISQEVLELYPGLAELTDIDNYKNYITPAGIEAYNEIMNGVVSKDRVEKKGLIMLIKEHNDTDSPKLPAPKALYKQVLFPRNKAFTVEAVSSDEQALNLITDYAPVVKEAGKAILDAMDDTDGIVVKYNALGSLSHLLFSDYRIIPSILKEEHTKDLKKEYDEAKTAKARKEILKQIGNVEAQLKGQQFELSYIFELCKNDTEFNVDKSFCNIKVVKHILKDAYSLAVSCIDDVVKDISADVIRKVKDNEEAIFRLRNMFDLWVDFRKMLIVFARKDFELGDSAYYNKFDEHMPMLTLITSVESRILGYVSKGPGDLAKKKMSFSRYLRRAEMKWLQPDDGTGGDNCKFKKTTCAVYKKDEKYYLLQAMDGLKPTIVFGEGPGTIFTQKKIGDSKNQLPKLVFSDSVKDAFDKGADEVTVTEGMSKPFVITKQDYKIYKNGLYTKEALKKGTVSQKVYKKNLLTILTLYKDFIESYIHYSLYVDKIQYRPLEEYEDSSYFFADVDRYAHIRICMGANDEVIEEFVNEGLMYMFLITSRGFEYKSDDQVDLFMEALENPDSDVELLISPTSNLREKTKEARVTHKKGDPLPNKKDINGYHIPDDIYNEIKCFYNHKSTMAEMSDKARSYIKEGKVVVTKKDEDLIKDKRYTEDAQQITFSVSKNVSCGKGLGKPSASAIVNEMKKGMNILAITRSMNDLLYVVVATPDGQILESKSLNVINKLDHYQRLKEISDDRKESKRDWNYGKRVANQRKAYMSDAISIIVRMMIDYNAFIVCEKIDDDVKDRYSAFDNQLFKKFEGMLISRLSDLHFRNVPLGQPGSVTNPYQLCDNNGNEFQDGIVFFVPNAYTFGVDLSTGFANIFEFKNVITKVDKMNFLAKFDSITYNKKKERFVFSFDYKNFVTKKNVKNNTKWTVYAGGPITKYNREYKYNEYIECTAADVLAKVVKAGHDGMDLSKVALDALLTSDEVYGLYNIFVSAVRGSVGAHDGERKIYISPVTGKEYDYSENSTLALIEKYKWMQKDKKNRDEWIDSIKVKHQYKGFREPVSGKDDVISA